MTPTTAAPPGRAPSPYPKVRARDAERRARLVGAARDLSLEAGTGFTVQDVLDRAGLSLKSFYRHFPSKDELLLAVFHEHVTSGAADVARSVAREPDPAAALRRLVTTYVRLADHPAGAMVFREHERLAGVAPAVVADSIRPFVDLLERTGAGLDDPELGGPVGRRDAVVLYNVLVSCVRARAFELVPVDDPLTAEEIWSVVAGYLAGRTRGGGHRDAVPTGTVTGGRGGT